MRSEVRCRAQKPACPQLAKEPKQSFTWLSDINIVGFSWAPGGKACAWAGIALRHCERGKHKYSRPSAEYGLYK